MSDEAKESNNTQQLSRDILTDHQGIKIDEKFVLKSTKGSKNVNQEVKHSCKVFHFSTEWNFEEVLLTIDKLDPKEYQQLFIFIIGTPNFRLSAEYQRDFFDKVAKIQEKLLKFGATRPMILQLTSDDENSSTIYFKEDDSNQFTAIDQQDSNFEEITNFASFLCSFLSNKIQNFEDKMIKFVNEASKLFLLLRFLRALNLGDTFFEHIILEVTKKGNKAQFLAILDAPFDGSSNWLSYHVQEYLTEVICLYQSEVRHENSEGIDNKAIINSSPASKTSVMLTAVENKNTEVIDYLTNYCTHLIQQLPFEHQVKISTAAFKTDQVDVLCDLLDSADFPFPKDFQPALINHERLKVIIAKRSKLVEAIKLENFKDIAKFLDTNSDLKVVFSTSNNSALYLVAESKKLNVFNYLKLRDFHTTNPNEKLEEFDKDAIKYAVQQRKHNISEGLLDDQLAVNFLCNRSLIHNKKISKEQEKEYRKKIRKWYEDINKIKNGPEFLNVVASCPRLKIIFDFENDTVENASLAGPTAAGSMYPISKVIFIGAKLSDKYGNTTKQREQKIKGVLAHELCHYVMKLVYENQEKPYFKDREAMKKLFELIVKKIDKWSTENAENPDDECNGIISSVYKLYQSKDFHPELIVRVVQILSEFDDNEDQTKHLEKMYKILFEFWFNHVVPDLQKYIQRSEEVIRLNGILGLLPSITKLKFELRDTKSIEDMMKHKIVIIQSNVPKLLLINILKYLQKKSENLFDSQNIFTEPEKLNNKQLLNDFKQICSDNKELRVFVDCSKEISNILGKNFINKDSSFIFVVSNQQQSKELIKIFNKKSIKIQNAQKLEINYKWSDLTDESQKLMLNTKINFQNNSQITLKDLLKMNVSPEEPTTSKAVGNEDLCKVIDDQLLNMLLDACKTPIIKPLQEFENDNIIECLFQPRKFLKNYNYQRNFEITQKELVSKVKNQQYVLISDQAGNGKSWAMKNFTKMIREQNPTSWVTYVDLKQYIDEFKPQNGEPEFSTFMIDKILKLKQQFEAEIFKKLYKNGKVFILFDGFDEIVPNCAEFVSKLAQNFKFNGGNQLWIATRDYFEVDLMEKLQLDDVYRLYKMTEDEGVDLIAKSWILMDLKGKNEPKSKEEFEECIQMSTKYENYRLKARKLVKKALISRDDSVGLPQLFKMIADGFKDVKDVGDLHGSKIYGKFIDIMYIRWSRKKGKIRKKANVKSQKFKLNFYKFHQYHAVLSLFPELAAILFPGYDGSEWPEEEVIACGILTKRNGKYYFLHETFREYFVADAIAHALNEKEVEKKVIRFVDEILAVEKFKIIRTFLFPVLNEKSMLEKVKPQIEKGIYCKGSFGLFFTENLENLADFSIRVLKNGNYKKVKAVLNENAKAIASNTPNAKLFLNFQEFVFDFLKVDDFKDLIIKQEVFQGTIESSLEIEIFQEFVTKTEAKTDREFIRKGLMLTSDDKWVKGNIFYFLSETSNLNAHKVNKFLKIMENFLKIPEIFVLMSRCNDDEQNILQVCVENKNKENLKILWIEIEKYFAVKNFSQTFKEFVKQQDDWKRNILNSASKCENIEVHETLWELLLKTIKNPAELKDFILQKYYWENNFVHKLVRENKNPAIIEWTFNVMKENFNEAQLQEILKSKGYFSEMNLLQTATYWSKVIKIHQFLWTFFLDLCATNEKFLEMLKEVNKKGENILYITAAENSSSEVFEFMIHELGKIASQNEIRQMLMNVDKNWNQNILQTAALYNKSSELHETLWKILRKYFKNSEILEFIKNVDFFGNNLLFNAAEKRDQEIVELTWNEIKSFLNHDEQIEYLKIKGENSKNLIEMSLANYLYKKEVNKWVETQLEIYGIKF